MLPDYPIFPTLPASDIPRARSFYQDVLGFEPTEVIEETGEVVYNSGGISFFVYPSSSAGTNQGTAAAWRVPDLRAMVDLLREKGVIFEEYDFDEIKTVDSVAVMPDGTQVAWFKDSEGNVLAMDQLPHEAVGSA
jgi:catechol 2,3-dioxygenase-like lactoylglutathione lyase family enzyme